MRTVIDLPAQQVEALADICRKEGISRAEAIRRAVAVYLEASHAAAGADAFGLWADREADGVAYQRRLRGEWGPE